MPEFDFIKAAYGKPHERVPIWIMRQAGRYLPEYRSMREKVSFAELCRTPELMAKITKQPIDAFGFDAAILFSDILLPLEPLGVKVSYDEGGVTISPSVNSPEDVTNLTPFDPADEMGYVLSGVGEIKEMLGDIVPLIGFCGAPFTLACYLVEGSGSWNFSKIKRFLYNHPKGASRLLDHLAEMTGEYLKAQIKAGADAVQLFDTWGGILPPEYYAKYSLPYIRQVFEICKTEGIPRILYLYNSAPYLKLLSDLDCEVVGIDWRTDAGTAARILDGKAIQGNLDPQMLFAPRDLLHDETVKLLKATKDLDGFIFNLGHGILPDTPVESVRLLVDTVHSFSRQ